VSLCTGTENETENETQAEETQKYKKKKSEEAPNWNWNSKRGNLMLIITRPPSGNYFSRLCFMCCRLFWLLVFIVLSTADQNHILNDKEYAGYISSSAGRQKWQK